MMLSNISLRIFPYFCTPQIKDATAKIKELADVRTQSMDDVDSLLRIYHSGIQSGELAVGQKEALDRLLHKHKQRAIANASRDSSLSRPVSPVNV
jgi:homocitrate synthase